MIEEKKLYVFDLDGTLLNTLSDLAYACNGALEHFSYPRRTIDEVESFIGNGVQVLMQKAGPKDLSDEEASSLLERFREIYQENLWRESKSYEGIEEVLDELKREGHILAVLTNKPEEQAKAIVMHFYPDIFKMVIGQSERFPKKPDPSSLQYLMDTLGFDLENTIYLGDSDVDMRTAKAAGVSVYAASWGFCRKDELLPFEPDRMMESPREIL